MTIAANKVEHPVEDPTDLSRDDYKEAVKSAFKEMKNDDVPTLASAAAFRLFLSFFPSLVATVAVWSLVTDPAELTLLIERLRAVLPGRSATFIIDLMRELAKNDTTEVVALILGVAAALVAATGAAAGLMKALSRAYDVRETRNIFKLRLRSVLLCLALLVALIAVFLLLVVGPQVEDVLLNGAPGYVDAIVTVARYALALVVLMLLFAFTYWIGPNRKQPSWEWISPGAAVATVGWLLASLGFTFYVQSFGTYDRTYGTLAGPIVFMLWLQITMLIVLVGAEINAEILRRKNMYKSVESGIGFAVPAPSSGLFVDPESAGGAVAEARVELAGRAKTPDGTDRAASVPSAAGSARNRTVDLTDDDDNRPKRIAGVAAAVIGGALALGFARKRR